MNKSVNRRTRFLLFTGSTVFFVAALLTSTANAEYRCVSPSSQEERHACELAARDAPDDLRLFIQRTSSIYGLRFNDYVRGADFDRWDLARQEEKARSLAADDGRNVASKTAPTR